MRLFGVKRKLDLFSIYFRNQKYFVLISCSVSFGPNTNTQADGGLHSIEEHTFFSPSSPGFHSQRSQKNFRGKIIYVAEVKQWCWLEESEQWLENIDQTRLALVSGKPVLQKTTRSYSCQGILAIKFPNSPPTSFF